MTQDLNLGVKRLTLSSLPLRNSERNLKDAYSTLKIFTSNHIFKKNSQSILAFPDTLYWPQEPIYNHLSGSHLSIIGATSSIE